MEQTARRHESWLNREWERANKYDSTESIASHKLWNACKAELEATRSFFDDPQLAADWSKAATLIGVVLAIPLILSFLKKSDRQSTFQRAALLTGVLALPTSGWLWRRHTADIKEVNPYHELHDPWDKAGAWKALSAEDQERLKPMVFDFVEKELLSLGTGEREEFDAFLEKHGVEIFSALLPSWKTAFDHDYQLLVSRSSTRQAVAQPLQFFYSHGEEATRTALSNLNEEQEAALNREFNRIRDLFPIHLTPRGLMSIQRDGFDQARQYGPSAALSRLITNLPQIAASEFIEISTPRIPARFHHAYFPSYLNGEHTFERENETRSLFRRMGDILSQTAFPGDSLSSGGPAYRAVERGFLEMFACKVLPDIAAEMGLVDYQAIEHVPAEALTQPIGYRAMFEGVSLPRLIDGRLEMVQLTDKHADLLAAYERVFTAEDKGAAAQEVLQLIGNGDLENEVRTPSLNDLQWNGTLPESPFAEIELYFWMSFFVSEQLKADIQQVQDIPEHEAVIDDTLLRNALGLYFEFFDSEDEVVRRTVTKMLRTVGMLQFATDVSEQFTLPEGHSLNTEQYDQLWTQGDRQALQTATIDLVNAWVNEKCELEGSSDPWEGTVPEGFNWAAIIPSSNHERPYLLSDLARDVAYQRTTQQLDETTRRQLVTLVDRARQLQGPPTALIDALLNDVVRGDQATDLLSELGVNNQRNRAPEIQAIRNATDREEFVAAAINAVHARLNRLEGTTTELQPWQGDVDDNFDWYSPFRPNSSFWDSQR